MKYTDEQLAEAVGSSRYMAEVVRCLGLSGSGGTYDHLRSRIARAGIDISHFATPSPANNLGRGSNYQTRSADEILVLRPSGSRRTSTVQLRRALIDIGRPEKCCKCGVTDWEGMSACLEIDHLNGNNVDDRRENLHFLCPICHTQKTHGFWPQSGVVQVILTRKRSGMSDKVACPRCGCPMDRQAKRCKPCSLLHRPTLIEWPDPAVLDLMVRQNSYVTVGRMLGVSDNAVRKRLQRHPPR